MKRYATKQMSALTLAATLCALFTFISFTSVDDAKACRDCPFPMPMASQHWLMPGGLTEITIEEINLGQGRVQTVIRLFESHSKELLAIGSTEHARGRKRLRVTLRDANGGRIQLDLHYQNATREKIQVKMKCTECNLAPNYLE